MTDPKLTAVKASICYKADDGHRSEETLGSMREGADDPFAVLASTVREASRLLALFGRPELAEQSTKEAVEAVAVWRASR